MAKTKQNAATQPAPVVEVSPLPDWLMEAHKHFHLTGFYRPEDVQRVIGSQREGVEVRAESDWSTANYLKGAGTDH